jgi:hypothetical protein
MISPEQTHTDEINLLLEQIDKYSLELSNLKTELETEKKVRARLELRLEMMERNKLQQTRQQTRIMRRQEETVRDLSCELDSISRKLKKSERVGFSWEDKAKDFTRKLEEKDTEISQLKEKLNASQDVLKKQSEELRDAKTIVELYDQLKLHSRTEEMRRVQQNKSILNKARELYLSYRNVQNEMFKNEKQMKEKLSKSAVVPVNLAQSPVVRKFSNPEVKETETQLKDVYERRLNVFKTENTFLKKKIITLLNKYLAEVANDQSQLSDIEISFYQKSMKPNVRRSVSKLPGNNRRTSISQLINTRKSNENENSIFKINTLKIPKMKINKSGRKMESVLPINKKEKSKVDQVKSSRMLFPSTLVNKDNLKEKARDQSTKSDLVKSNHLRISCLESSSVIGGQTFHMVTQKNLRKISKYSEQEKSNFISKCLYTQFLSFYFINFDFLLIRRSNYRNYQNKNYQKKKIQY